MASIPVLPGDIIGFCGKDWLSHGINVGSLGIPFFDISHVGIVGPSDPRWPSPLVYEAIGGGGRSACLRQGIVTNGFQCHTLDEILTLDYHAIYWYRLREPLYPHEEERLQKELNDLIGRPYDYYAPKSGGPIIYQLVHRMFGRENLSAVFCSESVAYLEGKIGRFNTPNAGAWSPNSLIRKMRRSGGIDPGIKIGPVPHETVPLAV